MRGIVFDQAQKIVGELRVGPYDEGKGAWAIIRDPFTKERKIVDVRETTQVFRFQVRYTAEALAAMGVKA